jgi:hypothetical protein
VATLGDYAAVRELVSGLIAEGVEATVPKVIRETVEAVDNVISGWGKDYATNKAVAEELEIDKAAARRRVRTAIGRGYLENLEERKGRPARLVLGEKMPEDQAILPAPEELEEASGCTVDRRHRLGEGEFLLGVVKVVGDRELDDVTLGAKRLHLWGSGPLYIPSPVSGPQAKIPSVESTAASDLFLHQLSLDDEALFIVWQSAGLERHDGLALDRIH